VASQKAFAKSSRADEFGITETSQYSEANLKETVTAELLETHIYTKIREKFTNPGSVSQAKLEKYFNEHKQVYAEPERRSIAFVTTKSQSTAEAIAKEHNSGGLQAAAGKRAATATSTSLGCQHPSAGGATQSSLIASICAAKTGVVSAPVKATSNYYVFEVKSTTPATKPSFAQEKERIKQLLASQGQEQGILKYNEEHNSKLKDQTECAAGYIVTLCKEYILPKPKIMARAKPPTH
jgi:parvulin-like peptidyl-prolyl isomerase